MFKEYEIVGTYEKDNKQYPESSCLLTLRDNTFKKRLLINHFHSEEEFKQMQENYLQESIESWKKNRLDDETDEDIERKVKNYLSSSFGGLINYRIEHEMYNLALKLDYSLEEIKEELISQFQHIMFKEISNFTDYKIFENKDMRGF